MLKAIPGETNASLHRLRASAKHFMAWQTSRACMVRRRKERNCEIFWSHTHIVFSSRSCRSKSRICWALWWCVCVHVCMCVCMCVRARVYVYVHVCVRVCIRCAPVSQTPNTRSIISENSMETSRWQAVTIYIYIQYMKIQYIYIHIHICILHIHGERCIIHACCSVSQWVAVCYRVLPCLKLQDGTAAGSANKSSWGDTNIVHSRNIQL